MQKFRLIPYPANDLPKIHITGEIMRADNQLSIRYEMRGEIDQIALPENSELPIRKDDLWKATCFEFFVAIPNQPQYWEFNLSPSSDWNVYHMNAYRKIGFREEKAIVQLPFDFKRPVAAHALDISVDLNPIIHHEQVLQIGITAIIQTDNGNESYWALTHPGPQADFHMRESFALIL